MRTDQPQAAAAVGNQAEVLVVTELAVAAHEL
jgi:hypothetical protein